MKHLKLIIACVSFIIGLEVYSDVVINEVQSSNDTTCVDENGESPDWIELYNNGEEPVDLEGWGLSDNAAKPFKWTFPKGAKIEASGYLRVFADSTKAAVTNESINAMSPNDASLNDDLVAWLKADEVLALYGEGGRVTNWQDASEFGNDATNSVLSTSPRVYGDVANGHAAVRFSEIGRTQLFFNNKAFNGMESFSNFTVFVVSKWSGATPKTAGHGLWGLSRVKLADPNLIFQVSKQPLGYLGMRVGSTSQSCIGGLVSKDAWYNMGSSLDSERETPRMTIYKNGTIVSFGDFNVVQEPMSAFSCLMLGRGFVGDGRFYDGDIAEFILYRRKLTEREYKAVYLHLAEKYALEDAPNLHTSFSLSGSGEDLCLTPLGASEPCDQVSFGRIPCDTSFGRTQEGWAYFAEPTPGAENTRQSFDAPLDEVVFSRTRGIYTEEFEVELSHADPEARIYYTTDHSEPSEENGVLYTEPIRISGTTIVRATAVKDGSLSWHNVAANSYIFLSDILSQQKPDIAPDIWDDGGTAKASYGISDKVVYDEATFQQFVESLRQVPIVSITMSDEDLFDPQTGLYTKARTLKGQEKAASVEWVTGSQVFGIEAGIRTQGNSSPAFKYTPKKSFRLCFRGRYGAGSLDKPVLAESGCDTAEFNTLILRAENGSSWPSWNDPAKGTNMRDQFIRNLQGEMSGYQSEGTHVGVFINGLYWGLYNLSERPDSHTFASKFGGDERNYNVAIPNGNAPTSRNGTIVDYRMWSTKISSTDLSNREAYLDAIAQMDINSFIDYMIIKNYIADGDWPYNNWVLTYSSVEGVPFRFLVWDSEGGLKTANRDLFGLASDPPKGGPQVAHVALMASPEYRLRFADRVQKHVLSGDAPLSIEGLSRRYGEMAKKVRPRIFAEEARWGHYHEDYYGGVGYGLEAWDAECYSITNTFVSARFPIFMTQLKKYGLYPNVNAAALLPSEEGAAVSMSAEAGTIYYTTDGSDPRVAFEGTVRPAALRYEGESITSEEDATIKARVLSAEGEWSALTEMPIVGSAPAVVRNEFLLSTNGENWDKDANWSEGYFPNEAGATAVVGVPTEFKKDKGWRNIHINKTNVTVGHLEVTSGGCTNRIDTGKSGNLTFSGKLDAEGVATEAASIVVMDEANPSLLVIDLDAPNKVVLATDLEVVVSNAVGDVEYGGALFKGAWEGNGHNLAKSGVGRLTLDVANTAETAFGKIQVAEGSVDITKKLYAEAITKDGVCSAKLGGSELEAAVAAASELTDKVSVNNVRLFIPSYLGGATYYGAFVATSLTTANAKKGKTVSAYIRDRSGDVHFDGKTYRRLADATIGTQTLEDGRVTYKVSVPQQDVRAEISSMAQGEGLAIGMETLPGQKYTLQYRELLDAGEWADVMTIEGDGQFHEFTVEMSGSSGFYRVVIND